MTIHVGYSGDFVALGADREDFEREAAGIMRELLVLEASGCGITDPAVAIDLSKFVLTVELEAEADSFDQAHANIVSCIRTAIHAVGGGTPGWEFEPRRALTELVDA